MLPEPTDTFAVLNHMFLTVPLDKQLQDKLNEKKIKIYSHTRRPIEICNRKKELMVSVMRKCHFTYTIFDTHHIMYPRMNISIHKSSLLQDAKITLSKNKLPYNCFLMGAHKWTNNYYHFITEILPSIMFMNNYSYPYPIVIHQTKFTEPLFRWFGVNNEIVSSIGEDSVLFQQEYIECGNPSPEKIHILRDFIESHVCFNPSVGILIYRKESIRSIMNHDEILETLKKITPDMEWLVFNDESILETVSLFSRAKVIVAPHGAGLTNMIFSKKGIKVIEFMPVKNPNICYWHLADSIGHDYRMIPVDETEDKRLAVNLGEVQPILAELLVSG